MHLVIGLNALDLAQLYLGSTLQVARALSVRSCKPCLIQVVLQVVLQHT